MDAATIAMACLWLALGQGPAETNYYNVRALKIPPEVEEATRSNIRELRLFASTDQGKSWQGYGAITPDKDFFAFYPPGDGTYFMRVVSVSRLTDKQEPESPAGLPPQMIVVIDTAKPIMHQFKAQRQGDEVQVSWQ